MGKGNWQKVCKNSLGNFEENGRGNCTNILKNFGDSLAVQELRLQTSFVGSVDSALGQGTKIPHAMWCSKKKKSNTL